MLRIELDRAGLEQALSETPAVVLAAIETKMQAITIGLQAHVVNQKLHGQVLQQRSGALARSIQRDVETGNQQVVGQVYSAGDVKYAAIHEFGGTTPPHDIFPTKGEALRFVIGGKTIFAKVVHHPGSKMPERSFMRSSLRDQASDIVAGLRSAAIGAIRSRMGQ